MFISTDGEGDFSGTPQGKASSVGGQNIPNVRIEGTFFPQPVNFGTTVLTEDIRIDSGPEATLSLKTQVHELGHLLGAGRNDDEKVLGLSVDEVYSGGPNDHTPEEVGFTVPESAQWSVMSSGWSDTVDAPPMNGRYIAFSIEELNSIEFEGVEKGV